MISRGPIPLPQDIENKEETWNTLFDRNTSEKEFFGGLSSTLKVDWIQDLRDNFITTHKGNHPELNYRCKLDIKAPIGYYINRQQVGANSWSMEEFIIDPYDEKYKRPKSRAQQFRSKHYKVVGSGHVKDQPYIRGYDYEIYEKTFMFVKLIDSVSGSYSYLLPAMLTQKCTAIVEQTRAYYPKTASGTINMALDEFIRRKHNPTQKEVTDFLIGLIWDKEIYLSEEPSFLTKIYVTQNTRIGGHMTLLPHSLERKTTFVKANFIANTDANAILSSIGYIR